MADWYCSMPGGVPPRPRCSAQCAHCAKLAGGAFRPGMFHEELFTGGFVDLEYPHPSAIAFEDIAEALSKTCRYTGHCRGFYSVAEHAVLVATRLEDLNAEWEVVLAGLHHDDAEALTGDIGRPLKRLLGSAFRPIEKKCHQAVIEALGISRLPFDDPAVKEADEWALMQEAYRLMPSKGANWYPEDRFPIEELPWDLGWDWKSARRAWILHHLRIMELCHPTAA